MMISQTRCCRVSAPLLKNVQLAERSNMRGRKTIFGPCNKKLEN